MSGQVLKYGIVEQIPIDKIDESPFQVRFGYGDVEGLANDIKKRGLLQPILVRPIKDRYEIVHGHRRFEATKKLGNKFILGVIRELDDESSLLIHGSENIQRKNLSHIEEALLYKKYMEKIGKTQKETALSFEVSLDTVENKLSLLELPQDIQSKIHDEIISFSKARQLTILTRETDNADRHYGKAKNGTFTGPEPVPRTDRWHTEIRQIASEPSLKTEREIAETAKLIREGSSVQEAITKVKKDSIKEKIEKGGRSINELIKIINNREFDEDELLEARKENFRALVTELLNKGWLTCPECGKSEFYCDHCGRQLE